MINYLSKPFKWFFKLEAASGLILLIAAILALLISNSDFSDLYFHSLEKYLFIGINEFGLKLSVHHWINDALMAIFFFFVTLEIKREFIQGELSNIKQALLPIIAAVGGMLVPALFYVFIISFVALTILIDTLKTPLINIFPGLETVLFSLFEMLKDIKLFIIDLY